MLMLLLGQAAPVAAPPRADQQHQPDDIPEDIVVQAVKKRCRLRFANKPLSDREFNARATGWASGRPIRVIARETADIKCLSKIAFRLADRGVKLIEFVDPRNDPPVAPPVPQ